MQKSHSSQLSMYQQLAQCSLLGKIVAILCLSWLFALLAQCIIPMPFNLVPIYPHPLPLLLAVLWLQEYALYAYGAYIIQGAAGLPFFSRAGSGIMHLCGPTGGYLVGFFFAMSLLCALMKRKKISLLSKTFWLMSLGGLYFCCGLLQLSRFVPQDFVLTVGLYPFLVGDSIKLVIVLFCWHFKKI